MPTKDDLVDLRTEIKGGIASVEKRLGDRIEGVNGKSRGAPKKYDAEAMQRTDLNLHDPGEDLFGLGRSKHPKHLPL